MVPPGLEFANAFSVLNAQLGAARKSPASVVKERDRTASQVFSASASLGTLITDCAPIFSWIGTAIQYAFRDQDSLAATESFFR